MTLSPTQYKFTDPIHFDHKNWRDGYDQENRYLISKK